MSLEYTGEQDLTSPGTGKKLAVTDHVVVSVKGPQSNFHFEIYFARDPQRTPLSIRIPLNLGTIALEWCAECVELGALNARGFFFAAAPGAQRDRRLFRSAD